MPKTPQPKRVPGLPLSTLSFLPPEAACELLGNCTEPATEKLREIPLAPPFKGGQCSVRYRVDYEQFYYSGYSVSGSQIVETSSIHNRLSEGKRFEYINGPIKGIFFDRAARTLTLIGSNALVLVRHATTIYEATIISVSRTDGLIDNCGDLDLGTKTEPPLNNPFQTPSPDRPKATTIAPPSTVPKPSTIPFPEKLPGETEIVPFKRPGKPPGKPNPDKPKAPPPTKPQKPPPTEKPQPKKDPPYHPEPPTIPRPPNPERDPNRPEKPKVPPPLPEWEPPEKPGIDWKPKPPVEPLKPGKPDPPTQPKPPTDPIKPKPPTDPVKPPPPTKPDPPTKPKPPTKPQPPPDPTRDIPGLPGIARRDRKQERDRQIPGGQPGPGRKRRKEEEQEQKSDSGFRLPPNPPKITIPGGSDDPEPEKRKRNLIKRVPGFQIKNEENTQNTTGRLPNGNIPPYIQPDPPKPPRPPNCPPCECEEEEMIEWRSLKVPVVSCEEINGEWVAKELEKTISVIATKNGSESAKVLESFRAIAAIAKEACEAKNNTLEPAVLSVPEWWQVRVGANRPQLHLIFAEKKDEKLGRSRWTTVVPWFDESKRKSLPLASLKHTKGNWQAILRLKDNSKVIVYTHTLASAEALARTLLNLVQSSQKPERVEIALGQRKGSQLKKREVVPVLAHYWETGQLQDAPTWTEKLYSN